MPAPVREALDSITGAARPGSSESRLAMLFAALPDWDGTEPFNILLMGIDQRDDEREAGSDPGRPGAGPHRVHTQATRGNAASL